MKKRDDNKTSFNRKNLVKLAPAAVVLAAVAAAGVQAGENEKEVAKEIREVVKAQDLEKLLKTAYSYEKTESVEEPETKDKKTNSGSVKKKTAKASVKKGGIKKGTTKALPVKTAASSGVGQGTTTTPTTEIPEGGYKDGTYQGSGTGFGGTISVQVTVSGGKIAAVNVLSASGETGSYFASAQGVISKILSSQSPNVDAVSGATYSSNGIIQAVQNALSQAGKSDTASPTPTPTKKPSKKPASDVSVSYKDGVYEGQAEGFNGIVTVKVKIKNGKIKKITNTNTDTPEFFNKAWKSIQAEVLSRQSTSEVDTVSGATFSSNGILGALNQALSGAVKEENSGEDIKGNEDSGSDTNGSENNGSMTPEEPVVPTEHLLNDGTYTASAMGYSGQVNITLTIKDGKITEISNTNSDTRSFFNRAWRVIQPAILEKQSIEGIDTVSGATFSSMGILDASGLALEQAKNTELQPSITPEPTKAPEDTITPEPTKAPEDTITPEPTKVPEDTGTPGPTQTPEETVDPEPSKTPEPTMTPDTGDTPQPTAAPEPTQIPVTGYKDGIYTGTGMGNGGEGSVQVTISGGKIVSASCFFGWDDEEYLDEAWNEILGQVMGKQSADGIDTVSGCTYSSQGILQAFQNALNQAKGA